MSQVVYMDIPQQELQENFIEVHKLTETVITEQDQVQHPPSQHIDDLEDYFDKYRLNQNFFTKEQVQQQHNFTMVRGKNYVYIGGFTDKMKHGMGLLIAGGNVYEGNFQLNLKMGKGYHRFSSGASYIGDFVNGKPHGNGTFTYPNKEVYVGEFQNGLIHGSGMWKSPKGDRYIGEWKNNKADGYGIHVWINGDKYEGQFKEFLKHGQGFEKFANGDTYKGEYEGGKPNGYGVYVWHNGSVFKGMFKCGLRHGKGVWMKGGAEGDSYEGSYQNDRKCGYGMFRWCSGNVYKGQFFDDLRHGEGEMYWSDGSYYKGMWEKGLQHGRGVICFKGMPERRGLFENNGLVLEQPHLSKVPTSNPLIANDLKKSIPFNQNKIINSFYGEPEPFQRTAKHRNNSILSRTKRHNQSVQQITSNRSTSKEFLSGLPERNSKKPVRTLVKRKKK